MRTILRKRAFLPVVIAAALPLLLSAADGKPDFSGDWKLDVSRSEFGPMPVPDKVVQKIVHKDSTLTIDSTEVNNGAERKLSLAYRTDGTPTKSKVGDNEMTSTATWEGATLAIESKLTIPGRTLVFKERWTMSDEKNSFTVLRTVSMGLGDTQFKSVMVRQ